MIVRRDCPVCKTASCAITSPWAHRLLTQSASFHLERANGDTKDGQESSQGSIEDLAEPQHVEEVQERCRKRALTAEVFAQDVEDGREKGVLSYARWTDVEGVEVSGRQRAVAVPAEEARLGQSARVAIKLGAGP